MLLGFIDGLEKYNLDKDAFLLLKRNTIILLKNEYNIINKLNSTTKRLKAGLRKLDKKL